MRQAEQACILNTVFIITSKQGTRILLGSNKRRGCVQIVSIMLVAGLLSIAQYKFFFLRITEQLQYISREVNYIKDTNSLIRRRKTCARTVLAMHEGRRSHAALSHVLNPGSLTAEQNTTHAPL